MGRTGFAAIAATLGIVASAHGEDIKWTQTINTPKGANLPGNAPVDLLGIELGEGYASAKPKIEKLHRDSTAAANKKSIEEVESVIRMTMPNGSVIDARYPGFVDVKTEVPGSGKLPIEEWLSVYFSAPSSGQQVIGISRRIDYPAAGDQPRIAELVALLKAKYKAEPQLYPDGNSYEIQFVFVKGRAVDPKNYSRITCNADSGIQRDLATSSNEVPRMNREGKCDVVLRVDVQYGISREHAGRVRFLFSDIERAKANLGADYAFFGSYVKRVQDGAKGAAPKL